MEVGGCTLSHFQCTGKKSLGNQQFLHSSPQDCLIKHKHKQQSASSSTSNFVRILPNPDINTARAWKCYHSQNAPANMASTPRGHFIHSIHYNIWSPEKGVNQPVATVAQKSMPKAHPVVPCNIFCHGKWWQPNTVVFREIQIVLGLYLYPWFWKNRLIHFFHLL